MYNFAHHGFENCSAFPPQADDLTCNIQPHLIDNAKDIAIIWPDFDPSAKGFKLFISGLSNETAVVKHPIIKDKDVYLRKTLELDYILRSDPALRSSVKLNYRDKRWVMR